MRGLSHGAFGETVATNHSKLWRLVLLWAEQKDPSQCVKKLQVQKTKKENLFDTCEHLSGEKRKKKPSLLEVIVLHTCWQKPWLHFLGGKGQIFLTYFVVPAEPRRTKATDSVWKWLQQCDYRCDSRLPLATSMQSPTNGGKVWRGEAQSAQGIYKCNGSYSHQPHCRQRSEELIFALQLKCVCKSIWISLAGI